MALKCCFSSILFIPTAALAPEPLYHLQMTMSSYISAYAGLIPGAALAPEPLQYLQVTTHSCIMACPCIPGAALAPEPLQYLQVTILHCPITCVCNQGAALVPEPLQYLQMASSAGICRKIQGIEGSLIRLLVWAVPLRITVVGIQPKALVGCQPLQYLQLASVRCKEEEQVRSQNKE